MEIVEGMKQKSGNGVVHDPSTFLAENTTSLADVLAVDEAESCLQNCQRPIKTLQKLFKAN